MSPCIHSTHCTLKTRSIISSEYNTALQEDVYNQFVLTNARSDLPVSSPKAPTTPIFFKLKLSIIRRPRRKHPAVRTSKTRGGNRGCPIQSIIPGTVRTPLDWTNHVVGGICRRGGGGGGRTPTPHFLKQICTF